MSSTLQYQTLSLQLYLLQDQDCPLIKEGRSKCMDIQGQTPGKTLIIQFHLHHLQNKLELADFKILKLQLQSCRWNGKKLLPEIFFLSYQKRISPMNVFIVLQLPIDDFRVRTMGGKPQHYMKLKQIRYFDIINIAECWCKIDSTFEGSVISQVEVGNIALLHFSKWLCLVHGQLAMSLRHVKRSVICKCQCFCLFIIQQWSVLS